MMDLNINEILDGLKDHKKTLEKCNAEFFKLKSRVKNMDVPENIKSTFDSVFLQGEKDLKNSKKNMDDTFKKYENIIRNGG